MDREKKELLQEKRARLQEKIRLEELLESDFKPQIELFSEWKKKGITFTPKEMVLQGDCSVEIVQAALKRAPYHDDGLSALTSTKQIEAINLLLEKYPSQTQFRYLPAGSALQHPPSTIGEFLSEVKKNTTSLEDRMYLYYFRYPVLVEFQGNDLRQIPTEDILDPWHGDAVLFPEGAGYYLVYTLEEDFFVLE